MTTLRGFDVENGDQRYFLALFTQLAGHLKCNDASEGPASQ